MTDQGEPRDFYVTMIRNPGPRQLTARPPLFRRGGRRRVRERPHERADPAEQKIHRGYCCGLPVPAMPGPKRRQDIEPREREERPGVGFTHGADATIERTESLAPGRRR